MNNVRSLRGAAAAPASKRDRTRAAIMRAAESLIAERSADAVTVDEIVAAAGVAKGTFYNHFADKDALQRDVLQSIRIEVRHLAGLANSYVTDPARRIIRIFLIVLRFAQDNPERGRFLTRVSMEHLVAAQRPNEGILKEIAEGLVAGRLKIATADSAALLLLGLQQVALVRTLTSNSPDALPPCAQQLGEMLLRGLGLSLDEASMIASQEVDEIICRHEVMPEPDEN